MKLKKSWKSLAFLFALTATPALTCSHLFSNSTTSNNGPLQGMLLLVGFGIAPSLMLPYLVATVVQDNSDGIIELMVLQGLKINNHVIGTFVYAFIISFTSTMLVYLICLIGAAPMIINQTAAGTIMLFVCFVVGSLWTASVVVFMASLFKNTGMAVGISALLTLILCAAGLTIIILNKLISSNMDDTVTDNDFLSEPLPMAIGLAPFFGYFRAVIDIGDFTNQTKEIFADVGGSLGMTLVQTFVFTGLGTVIYARRIANRLLVPSTGAKNRSQDAMPLLSAVDGKGPSTNSTNILGQFSSTRKVFQSAGKPKVALHGLNLSLKRGEFLGVLGPNGAGKSTAFNIMAGLLSPTSGDAFVDGNSITFDCELARRYLGSCPQFPKLWPDLTVGEHLGIYATLRGLPCPWSLSRATRDAGRKTVEVLATVMQLGGATLSKKANQLSGGMKRRLSLAISMVGAPPLLVLDEPTTGLDPITRRDVWELLIRIQRNPAHACIISTHSMEEADTLCNRIAIMTKGRLRVDGKQDELKQRFGTGFTVSLTITKSNFDVDGFLKNRVHADAHVASRTGRVCNCHIPMEVSLAKLFRALIDSSGKGDIQDWLVSETKLEDVFIRVVQKHENEEEQENTSVA